MKIQLLAFASVADLLGTREKQVAMDPGATVDDLLRELVTEHPRLESMLKSLMISVNQDYVDRTVSLSDGDEVALIPPVSGGSGQPRSPKSGP